MKKTTTSQPLKEDVEKKGEVVVPARSTLDFIRIFARIYDPKNTLETSLAEVCVN